MGLIDRITTARNLRRISAKAELEEARSRVTALETQVAQLQSERDALLAALNAERAEWERERAASYERELEANTRAHRLRAQLHGEA